MLRRSPPSGRSVLAMGALLFSACGGDAERHDDPVDSNSEGTLGYSWDASEYAPMPAAPPTRAARWSWLPEGEFHERFSSSASEAWSSGVAIGRWIEDSGRFIRHEVLFGGRRKEGEPAFVSFGGPRVCRGDCPDLQDAPGDPF